jgi:8-oxo-dGTP diphosphatase
VDATREEGEEDLNSLVRAAGGVVVRGEGAGRRLLVVHRPAYDDWTLPKGKAKAAETDEACAVREVEEETTLRCRLDRELPSTRYTDSKGRPKLVRWWLMDAIDDPDAAAPANEVDEVCWVAPDEARVLLTYRRDLAVLDALDAA